MNIPCDKRLQQRMERAIKWYGKLEQRKQRAVQRVFDRAFGNGLEFAIPTYDLMSARSQLRLRDMITVETDKHGNEKYELTDYGKLFSAYVLL